MDSGWPLALLQPLAGSGVTGAVLIWFMVRAEQRLCAIEQAITRLARSQDRLVRGSMLELLAHPGTAESVRAQARALLDELAAERPAAE
jgi:hypothetical protein